MNKAFYIYKTDLNKIITNWVLIIIVLGITILPPLYAWINIYASWDPYSNTKGIKIAVVNQDSGANFKDIGFNIGSEVVDSLKTNNNIGWIFCNNEDDGIEMTRKGDVYATIIIPEDFSKRMATVFDQNPIKPTLQYYVNEKENAIAPKMTDAAANIIQKQITSSILSTAVEKAYTKLNELGFDVTSDDFNIKKYLDLLQYVNDKMPEIDQKLDGISADTQDGLVKINKQSQDFIEVCDTLSKAIEFNNNFSNTLLDINAKIKQYSPEVKENLITAQSMMLNVSNSLGKISADYSVDKPKMIEDIKNAKDDLNDFESEVNRLKEDMIKYSQTVSTDVININDDLIDNIKKTRELINAVETNIDDITKVRDLIVDLTELNEAMLDSIKNIKDSMNKVFDSLTAAIQNAEDSLDEIKNVTTNTSSEVVDSAINAVSTANLLLNKYPKLFRELISINDDILVDLKSLKNNSDSDSAIGSLKLNYKDLSVLLSTQRSALATQQSQLNSQLNDLESILKAVIRLNRSLNTNLANVQGTSKSTINSIENTLNDTEELLQRNSDFITNKNETSKYKINTDSDKLIEKITNLKDKLNELQNRAENENEIQNILNDAQKLTYNIQTQLDTIVNHMDDDIIAKAENYLIDSSSLLQDINSLLDDTNSNIKDISTFVSEASEKGQVTLDEFNKMRKAIPKVQLNFSKISDKIDRISNILGFDDIKDFLNNDGSKEADFVSSMVSLSTHSVYKMPNYGTGLTPFYTVLSLWVGCLFLVALLTTKTNKKFNYTVIEEFMGKYMLFATLAALQGLIAGLGDIFILKVQAHNPALFIILNIFYSIVFSMIVYSLVATMNYVGKAVAVIFMLLQITGAGGTFPIQVTPPFFQAIHKLLPFTYAINGLREAIFGVMYDSLVKDVVTLIIYFIIFTVIGISLKKPLNLFISKFTKQLSNSGIMEH